MRHEQRRITANTQGESLTKQSFAPQQDVNNIVNRHMRSAIGRGLGGIAPGGSRQPIFGDFTSIDYQAMLNQVTDAQNAFRALPARIRTRFNNDPYQLIRFVENPDNLKESVKMGLIDLPQGMVVTEEGKIVEQVDLTKTLESDPWT